LCAAVPFHRPPPALLRAQPSLQGLTFDSRVAYQVHAYGPGVFNQSHFAAPSFPSNMPAVWDQHFGSAHKWTDRGLILLFGGSYIGADRLFQDQLVDYMIQHCITDNVFW
jgi:endoglucanase